jgi:hypothetical protein
VKHRLTSIDSTSQLWKTGEKSKNVTDFCYRFLPNYCCNLDDPDMLISGQQACPNFSPGADVGLKWRNFSLSQHSQTRINTGQNDR